jgi:hypothetical protein
MKPNPFGFNLNFDEFLAVVRSRHETRSSFRNRSSKGARLHLVQRDAEYLRYLDASGHARWHTVDPRPHRFRWAPWLDVEQPDWPGLAIEKIGPNTPRLFSPDSEDVKNPQITQITQI